MRGKSAKRHLRDTNGKRKSEWQLDFEWNWICRSVGSVRFSLDGKTILSASLDKTIKLWSSESGECTKTLTGHLEYENGKSDMELTD